MLVRVSVPRGETVTQQEARAILLSPQQGPMEVKFSRSSSCPWIPNGKRTRLLAMDRRGNGSNSGYQMHHVLLISSET
ncbi:hypothetical protein BO85DRAFT_454373 [Aspergillus piperis CBS 112811]|uniref:Uncharacterized protein n=1 Tax=Aspergillus piperis CBS 112811 TaxID=1448313 RepID=A0A8G1QSD0_9EURO|nr:hypothetical protein BO85DRAFT_454373 [Aspergillus piperis CBS 112811]RAH52051.1 hypothetical protein BO85DRAFT_454373 [Aspergillus piperis CBS 112811]